MLGTVVVYLVTDRLRIQPTLAGKCATLVQLGTVITVLLAPDIDWLLPHWGGRADSVMSILVAVVSAAAVISYTRLGLSFIAKEQKPLV